MTTTTERPAAPTADLTRQHTHEVIERLSQPDPVDLRDTLAKVYAESTPQQREDGYPQQARILAAILDRHVNPFAVVNAMDACRNIGKLTTGHCVTELYGCPNTESMRAFHLDAEHQNFNEAARAIGGTP